jgi:hypothetical protein
MGLRYMVTGAAASIIYGEPRLTHDVDVVVELNEEDAKNIIETFPSEQFYCPPIHIIKLEIRRSLRGHFNLIHHETGFKADIYTVGEDQLHYWAMSRRRQVQVEGESVWVAPPEYVILRKLDYYREGKSEKHVRDIASIMELSSAQIDLQELQDKIQEYSLEKEWKEAQKLSK